MKLTVRDMVEAADKQIKTISATRAGHLLDTGECVFVDIRDIRELQAEGKIPGATHAPRGMLEFWVDPESPYYREVFGQEKAYVFYCAAGWRSALATQTVQSMGMQNVCHIGGGFTAWQESNLPVETLPEQE